MANWLEFPSTNMVVLMAIDAIKEIELHKNVITICFKDGTSRTSTYENEETATIGYKEIFKYFGEIK